MCGMQLSQDLPDPPAMSISSLGSLLLPTGPPAEQFIRSGGRLETEIVDLNPVADLFQTLDISPVCGDDFCS